MRAEIPLWVAAGAARPKLNSSATVGSRTQASQDRESAHGYKRSFGASCTTSALGPAPDIQEFGHPVRYAQSTAFIRLGYEDVGLVHKVGHDGRSFT